MKGALKSRAGTYYPKEELDNFIKITIIFYFYFIHVTL